MPAFAAKIDPLMNRVRRLLARSAGKAMSYQMGRLSKDVKANLIKQIKTQKDTSPETKAKAVLWVESRQGRWRTAEEIETELFESVYTLTFRERWERLADKIAHAVARVTNRTGRFEFRRSLINAFKRQYRAKEPVLSGAQKFLMDGANVKKRPVLIERSHHRHLDCPPVAERYVPLMPISPVPVNASHQAH